MNDLQSDFRHLAAQPLDQIPNLPRISIITPCLNGERYIVDAIESVLRQGYPNCEHIVVDGASTDTTLTLLQRFSHLTIISEPDRGSHEAMNKGVRRASGDVIAFLNVDDSYPDNTLLKIGAAFVANSNAEILVGDTVVYEDDAPDHRAIRFRFNHPHGNWLPECMFGNPGINGCFFRRSVFDKIGFFDNDFHICADRDFVIRAELAGVTSVSLNTPALWYRAHGSSQTINRTRSNILPISIELFRMASHFLESGNKTRDHKRLARAWQAFEAARLAFVYLQRGQLSDAVKLFIGFGSRNPLWPFYLLRAIAMRRAVRQNYRGGWNADLSQAIAGDRFPG
jgi:glycosyltransferase involved in cell wall biosynthesis